MLKFTVKNRWSGQVQFTAEIDCAEGEFLSVKMGLAVKWAIETKANLRGANLRGANLGDANLRGAYLGGANLGDANLRGAYLGDANLRGAYLGDANLRGAYLGDANLGDAYLGGANLGGANLGGANLISDRVVDGGLRSDGYRFLLTRTEPGEWRIKAGCRNFPVAEGLAHWAATRAAGDPLGDETRIIVAHMIALAETRNWPAEGEALREEPENPKVPEAA